MGGSDQWGNITAGVELIRRSAGGRAHGIVSPLLTTASGTKFGKTAEGTVWLDAARTSPYRFYQFWLGSDDRDVASLLKLFTWLSRDEVGALEAEVRERPEGRQAQRVLAEEVTRMVHGPEALAAAQRVTDLFFGRDASGLTADQVIAVTGDVPTTELAGRDLEGEGVELVQLMVSSSLATSRGDARRAIQGGGIYLGTRRIEDPGFRVTLEDTIDRKVLVVRKGVKQHHVFRLVGTPGE
jgi:tyrosyl-tRNA synthetase